MCYIVFICVNVEYPSGCGRLHYQVREFEVSGRYGWKPGILSYCVLSVFIVFIRGNAHIVREVQYRPVGGRLVCYYMFCY